MTMMLVILTTCRGNDIPIVIALNDTRPTAVIPPWHAPNTTTTVLLCSPSCAPGLSFHLSMSAMNPPVGAALVIVSMLSNTCGTVAAGWNNVTIGIHGNTFPAVGNSGVACCSSSEARCVEERSIFLITLEVMRHCCWTPWMVRRRLSFLTAPVGHQQQQLHVRRGQC